MSGIKSRIRQPRNWPYLVNPLRPSLGEPYRAQVERMMVGVHDARRLALELSAGKGADRPAEAILVSHQLPIWVTRLAAEHRRLWHDPRQRECTLTSITSLDFDGGTIRRVRYAEPCADLLPEAAAFFRVERWTGGRTLDGGFAVLVVVGGAGQIVTGGEPLQVRRGDTVLLPAAAGDVEVQGDGLEVLVCRPPAASAGAVG